ncbi:MAG: phosphatidate cytidylyltransferase [Thiotrichaceae bacterium]
MFNNISQQTFYLLIGVFSVLLISSAVSYFLSQSHPDKNYSELIARIKSWWVMIGTVSVCILLGKTALIVFFAFVSFLALKEYLSLIPTRRADRRLLFYAYLSIPLQYYWVSIEWYGLFIIFIPVYMFLFIPLRMVTLGETEGFLKAVGTLHWGLMMTVFSLSHIAYLLALPENVNPAGSIALMLFLLVLTQFNDVAQYLWGKLLGKHKVIPKISPNKTSAGLLGGLFTITLLAIFLGPWLTPMTWIQSLGAGLIISLGGFFGDVTLSAVKRDIGIKDTGNLLPGHGGILDRVDSLTFSAPLFFHYIYYLYY